MPKSIIALNLILVGKASSRLVDLYENDFWASDRLEDAEEVKRLFELIRSVMWDLGEISISESLLKLQDDPPKEFELCYFVLDQIDGALTRMNLLSVDSADAHLLSKADAFGPDVSKAFPSSAPEILDAGSCIALGQPTAAVCHLMRALEPALNALAAEFGVGFKANWNSALDDIETAIRNRENSVNRPGWDVEKDFYIDAATHFFHVKNAWRNYTMHLRRRYNREEALEVYNDVRRLMQKMATKLHE